MRSCRKCLRLLPAESFGLDRSRPDGVAGVCRDCARAAAREYAAQKRSTPEGRAAHSECQKRYTARILQTQEGRDALNAAARERKRKWKAKPGTAEKIKEQARADKARIRATPEGRARLNAQRAQFDRKHPGRANAKVAARRAVKNRATPTWADVKAIRDFYENCPKGMHVDHIVPLKGERVSGLHTIANLQYLPAKDNCAKGNRHD